MPIHSELQTFVMECIQSAGGVVEVPEYGLAEALLPEDAARALGGQTFVRIAFDPEVAREHPDAELAVYGSEFLDRLIAFATGRGLSTVRYVHVDRLEATRVIERLQDDFSFVSCRPEVVRSAIQHFGYIRFFFKLIYLTDEREESLQSVLVNLNTNRPVKQAERFQQLATYVSSAQRVYPQAPSCSVQAAYRTACVFLKERAQEAFAAKEEDNQRRLETDLRRIHAYYDDLKEESERRIQRTSDSGRADAARHRLEVYEIERERRKRELEDKYSLRLSARLTGAELLIQPKATYVVRVSHRDRSFAVPFVWDPLLKTFEPPLCARCGEALWTLAFDRDGGMACWGKGQ